MSFRDSFTKLWLRRDELLLRGTLAMQRAQRLREYSPAREWYPRGQRVTAE
jgi:hypothetical protein